MERRWLAASGLPLLFSPLYWCSRGTFFLVLSCMGYQDKFIPVGYGILQWVAVMWALVGLLETFYSSSDCARNMTSFPLFFTTRPSWSFLCFSRLLSSFCFSLIGSFHNRFQYVTSSLHLLHNMCFLVAEKRVLVSSRPSPGIFSRCCQCHSDNPTWYFKVNYLSSIIKSWFH